MAKIVEKTSIDIVETAKTFKKYETLAIPLSYSNPGTIRTYINNAKKDGLITGEFSIYINKADNISVLTRVG